jgi:hypothetical protein
MRLLLLIYKKKKNGHGCTAIKICIIFSNNPGRLLSLRRFNVKKICFCYPVKDYWLANGHTSQFLVVSLQPFSHTVLYY